MKLFGPTSCFAKRSDLFLPKVRYVRKNKGFEPVFVTDELQLKKMKVHLKKSNFKVHLEKMQGHWSVCSPVFVFTP